MRESSSAWAIRCTWNLIFDVCQDFSFLFPSARGDEREGSPVSHLQRCGQAWHCVLWGGAAASLPEVLERLPSGGPPDRHGDLPGGEPCKIRGGELEQCVLPTYQLLFARCPAGGAVCQPGRGCPQLCPPAPHQQGSSGALCVAPSARWRGPTGRCGQWHTRAGRRHRLETGNWRSDGTCEHLIIPVLRPEVLQLTCVLFLISRLQRRQKSERVRPSNWKFDVTLCNNVLTVYYRFSVICAPISRVLIVNDRSSCRADMNKCGFNSKASGTDLTPPPEQREEGRKAGIFEVQSRNSEAQSEHHRHQFRL